MLLVRPDAAQSLGGQMLAQQFADARQTRESHPGRCLKARRAMALRRGGLWAPQRPFEPASPWLFMAAW
jgi:hypothetical protein